MWLLTSVSFPEVEQRWELRAGAAAVIGRTPINAGEVEASVAWRPAEPLAIVVSGAGAWKAAQPDFYQLSEPFEPYNLDPAEIVGEGSVVAAWTPVRGELGARALPFEGQLLAGPALIATHDLDYSRAPDPEWRSTANQLHPAVRWGAALRFGRAVGVHVQLDRVQWIEVVDSIQTNAAGRTALSGALSWRL